MASMCIRGSMQHRCHPCGGMSSSSQAGARRAVVAAAKKGSSGKKGGGGKQQKGSALAKLLEKKQQAEAGAALDGGKVLARPDQYKDPQVLMQLLTICSSYTKYTKKFLIEVDLEQLAEAIYKAPFALLAHDKYRPGVTEPRYTYANRAALRIFEGTWDDVIGRPSRDSADAEDQAERNALLVKADKHDYVSGYEGWRRSLKGNRWKMLDAKFFNLKEGPRGDNVGQAVLFDRYEDEEGKLWIVQGDAPPAAEEPEADPTEEDIAAAEQDVVAQAAAVRALKEEQGLTNQDPEVAAAVAELKARKDRVEQLQQRFQQAQREAELAADYDESALFDDEEDE